jgi:hypothetical protein
MAGFAGADRGKREHGDARVGDRPPTDECDVSAAIGLTLAEGKSVLAAMRTELVQAQADEYCQNRRTCPHCGARHAVKDWRTRQLTTLFGAMQVEAPRFNSCRCGVASRRIVSPLVEMMPDRCTPEYERILARMGSLAAYGRAAGLMAEFLPLDRAPAIETVRRRTLRVGARLEQQVLMAKPLASPPSVQSIAVSLDGGHVKSIRSYQMRSFEVMLACASNDQGEQRLFSSVPVEADRQRQQLSAVLRGLGATYATQVTVLSDGAESPAFWARPQARGRRVMFWTGSVFQCVFSTSRKRQEARRAGPKRISGRPMCRRRRSNGSAGGYGTTAPKGLST